jgi:two-component system, NarL family, invasion response regulator UvrY
VTRVYLVDDHAMFREGLSALLRSAGHEVVGEHQEPTQAVAAIVALQPDVVLLDLKLGERSGLEVIAEARRRQVDARFIVLTMSDQPTHVSQAFTQGARGYVLKGSSATEVLRAIDAVCGNERFLGAGVAMPDDDAPAALASAPLSPREEQILLAVVRGLSSAEIGRRLHLSPKTIDTYRSRLMSKLGLPDVPALVRFAIRTGLIEADER